MVWIFPKKRIFFISLIQILLFYYIYKCKSSEILIVLRKWNFFFLRQIFFSKIDWRQQCHLDIIIFLLTLQEIQAKKPKKPKK